LVVVFHSFGSVILNYYFKKYGNSKVFGFIDLGGFPITLHTFLRKLTVSIINLSD
jgi:hypothetical protein